MVKKSRRNKHTYAITIQPDPLAATYCKPIAKEPEDGEEHVYDTIPIEALPDEQGKDKADDEGKAYVNQDAVNVEIPIYENLRKATDQTPHRRRSNRCCVTTVILVIAVAILVGLAMILLFVVFRPMYQDNNLPHSLSTWTTTDSTAGPTTQQFVNTSAETPQSTSALFVFSTLPAADATTPTTSRTTTVADSQQTSSTLTQAATSSATVAITTHLLSQTVAPTTGSAVTTTTTRLPTTLTTFTPLSTQTTVATTTATTARTTASLLTTAILTTTAKVTVAPTTVTTSTSTTTATTARPTTALSTSSFHLTTLTTGADCEAGYAGRTFALAFPENYGPDPGVLMLYITATSRQATVNVSAPLMNNTGLWSNQTFTVSPNMTQVISVASRMQLQGTAVEQKGILVTATSNIVIFAKNRCTTYCGAFQAIPVSFLGKSYYTISTWPDPNTIWSFTNIAVVASSAGSTVVNFMFPLNKGISVTYQGNVYTANLTVTLSQWQTVQVQETSSADLSGTLITASQPVAVYSGDVVGNVVDSSFGIENPVSDHQVEQLIPINNYGTQFIVAPLNNQSHIYVRAVCNTVSTVIQINNNVTYICRESNMVQGYIEMYQPMIWIASTKPIMLTLISEGDKQVNAPSLVLVPPVTNYMSKYTFVVPSEVNVTNLILTTLDSASLTGFTINGIPFVNSNPWTRFTAGAVIAYTTRYLLISAGAYIIQSTGGSLFGAYVYGQDTAHQCSLAYSVGMNLGTANCAT